ncbi:unnamed protein product [Paramecium octaurelia]|uniref:Uncharacterized protein n=1 Tax=Paramecium octaurelia TaxID=43137 RepID=A0A8S1YT50_PAROT|nr:unnamed protein product [Paramecium octaurelia]
MCVSGGGSYDDGGFGIKIGEWIDLDEDFRRNPIVIHQGQYKNGKKFGKWDMKWNWTMQQISFMDYLPYAHGGGSYQEDGIKIGQWIDFAEGFSFEQQLIFKGEYKNGRKFGNWDIQYRICLSYPDLQNPFSKIGGGSYDEEGKGYKIGQWVDLDDSFNNSKQIIYSGQYDNGKKVGIWVKMLRESKSMDDKFIKVKEISYDN